ncbi:hypothetical protein BJY24_005600 [Nocardia transvalensis]|uniref:Uncharacterized protein n=1 Tax=Nocardia transvalensis TaxID=37333 RepID=A0A7W9PJM0_9NOCA|nr:hypothetical protein [Nocardia transvalensis]MBB5916688.1 hypothetical protein [Nocardia transvalensis]
MTSHISPAAAAFTASTTDPFAATQDFASIDPVFASLSDRLVRHLFDTGLRLDAQRRDGTDSATTAVLDSLDTLIRDTSLAMLDLARQTLAAEHSPRSSAYRPVSYLPA